MIVLEKGTRMVGFDETVGLLREIIRGNEEFVYRDTSKGDWSQCVYQKDGEPSCLVGHLLHRLGVTVEMLSDFDGWGYCAVTAILDLRAQGLMEFDQRSELLLSLVQRKQDNGITWGAALEDSVAKVLEQ